MVERFRQIVVRSAGEYKYVQVKPICGGDDSGFYSGCVPSIYFQFGSRDPGNETGVHTPTFGASDGLIVPTTEMITILLGAPA
ncbi:hypothetical protein [Rhizobium leguminosarum]|uniref:hypothetical protein n=1 Tax=Rhizobium leguminosarum TaxID=384 RepID=UPI0021BBE27E|nr:hypothetical protein [Rhizobium leguminosarum]